jgi:hypothetical protein
MAAVVNIRRDVEDKFYVSVVDCTVPSTFLCLFPG